MEILRHVDYLGDDRLRHKVVYDKESYSECIYCGKQAKTREHIPSKVLLSKSYPDNLGIVPSCKECNKSFSGDELCLSLLIEIKKRKHYGAKYIFSEEVESRIRYNKTLVKDIEEVIENGNLKKFDEKISAIVFKLAVGHSVYELSEGYCINKGSINYSFADSLSIEEIEEFSLPFDISGELFPEIGSRVYDRVIVLDLDLVAVNNEEQKLSTHLVLLDWVNVQDSMYSYTSYRFGDEIIIKMIISDFFYTMVTFTV
ncbi:hypothetical protein AB4114_22175 [Paenibacillus sp. 2RAB27]|uniref:hypothetical protein n=1 Tax=Paenibacillus sp. 2RAB27 TaxID=3232991 RepID=UPI003F9D82DF